MPLPGRKVTHHEVLGPEQNHGIIDKFCHTPLISNDTGCLISPVAIRGNRAQAKAAYPEKQLHIGFWEKDMRKDPQGFTLIELMVVVAIIGILAAIAIPAYQDYTIRAQVSEGLNLSAGAKTAISEYYVDRGVWPTDNVEAGLAAPNEILGKYTDSVAVQDNVIEIQFGNEAHVAITGESITLSVEDNAGSLKWTCVSAGVILPKHLPPVCR